jgi:hypothetical protein
VNSRQRFLETMRGAQPDHAPLFEEGLRSDVLEAWRAQGLPADADLGQMFHYDRREEIEVDLDHHLDLRKLPKTHAGLALLEQNLDPLDPRRLPANWSDLVNVWKEREYILMLPVQRGFFLTLGVGDWQSFTEMMYLVADYPDFVRQALEIQSEFAARFIDRILNEVAIEAAIFSEPISSRRGPLISPRMYRELALESYKPLLEVLRQRRVETVIFRTYANSRALLPSVVQAGMNCLWASERESQAMDYIDLRKEFGRDLRLIGGIDLDALRLGKKEIHSELKKKALPLLQEGRYIPLADGRVRKDISLKNYTYYRRQLEKFVLG